MGYKTKAEKRAYKDGLFAGLFGKKRKREKAFQKSQNRKSNDKLQYYHIGTIKYDRKGRPCGGDDFMVEARSETEARNKGVNIINTEPRYKHHKIDYVSP